MLFKSFPIYDDILQNTSAFTIESQVSTFVSIVFASSLYFENRIPNAHSTVFIALDNLLLKYSFSTLLSWCSPYGFIKLLSDGNASSPINTNGIFIFVFGNMSS